MRRFRSVECRVLKFCNSFNVPHCTVQIPVLAGEAWNLHVHTRASQGFPGYPHFDVEISVHLLEFVFDASLE